MIPGLALHENFVSAAEADMLWRGAQSEGMQRPEGVRKEKRWHDLARCNLRDHRFGYSATPLPAFVEVVGERVVAYGLAHELPYRLIFADYAPHQGMPAHTDSVNLRLQRDRHAILSLLSTRDMVFRPRRGTGEWVIPLPPLSLLMMEGEVRYEWTHEVLPGLEQRASLVFSFREPG